jgi:hypothetical protein
MEEKKKKKEENGKAPGRNPIHWNYLRFRLFAGKKKKHQRNTSRKKIAARD